MMRQKKLLAIVELGGYPDLTAVYEAAGHEVRTMRTLRKALSVVRDWGPDIVVSEFRYSPTYGSQLGNLESIIAALQRHVPSVRLIVLYDRDRQEQLQQLAARLPFHAALAFPLDIKALQRAVQLP